jgi:hypothetical protein
MRHRVFISGVLATLLGTAIACAAWDPDDCCPDEDPWYEPIPLFDAFEPAVAVIEPAPEPAVTPEAPAREPAPAVDVRDAAAELGFHAVTEVRTEDRVIVSGDRTTYVTETQRDDAGTFARAVASVGTGEGSGYDGLTANGRMTLSDGRPVAGVVYETVVWNGHEFVHSSFDFFADDSELARHATPVAPSAPIPPAVVAPLIEAPVAPRAPVSLVAPAFAPSATIEPSTGTERDTDTAVPSVWTPPASGAVPPSSVPGRAQPVPHDVRAGVALGSQADVLRSIEVLRGRRVSLWIRATVDGSPARVISWRLASGEVTALGPVAGSGEDPLIAEWLVPAETAFALVFEAVVSVPGEGARTVPAVIDVTVRSPAIVQ